MATRKFIIKYVVHIIFLLDCFQLLPVTVTFHQLHSVSGAIFVPPLKFQGEAAPLGQAFYVAVVLGLSHSNASQPLTLPCLNFNRDEKLSQKKWMSSTVQRALTPDTVRTPVFSLTCSCLNCDISERGRKSEKCFGT